MSETLRFPVQAPTPALEAWLDFDQTVLDALPLGVYACDADGRIVRVNQTAIRLWGRSPGPLDPAQRFCGCFRIESLEGEFVAPEQTPMARAVLHGERFENAEAVVQNPDGRRWVAQVNIAPLIGDAGEVIGAINCFRDITPEYELRASLRRQQHTFDLAMVAARMGTWRYTIADNICLYDENAQQLYGLAEAQFLHDEEGVKSKFHPDDLDAMWANVAKALDPLGDGRYEVEYRVKQFDGGWRWLSAWGLVEFEGEGPERKPVAIAGASRDLTEMKRAEQQQRLLANELNHRVKNSLATVQSITNQTLRAATDLECARDALEQRIVSLARAHDLLTDRSWSGADLRDVVHKAMEPFPPDRLCLAGGSHEVLPELALSLSLALHELATNAAKYGALSSPDGRVEIRWNRHDDTLSLTWRELGGPAVSPPTRRGFGSRLLEASLRDLGGHSRLEFAPDGVRAEFRITV
jgi:two-component sensor histidine kinase